MKENGSFGHGMPGLTSHYHSACRQLSGEHHSASSTHCRCPILPQWQDPTQSCARSSTAAGIWRNISAVSWAAWGRKVLGKLFGRQVKFPTSVHYNKLTILHYVPWASLLSCTEKAFFIILIKHFAVAQGLWFNTWLLLQWKSTQFSEKGWLLWTLRNFERN